MAEKENLRVVAGLDLKALALDLIKEILENWDEPFFSPVVVFPDGKVQQWFKFFWMNESGKSILMNLKFKRLEGFVYGILSEMKDRSTGLLSSGILRDVLIKKLSERVGDKFYFESLGSKEVLDYLSYNGGFDSNHMFDFASSMASLFIDYDSTDSLCVLEGWQKKLYEDVVSSGVKAGDKVYFPLGMFLEKNRKQNGGSLKFSGNGKGQKVYLFGFNGMNQLYRKILLEYGRENSISIYLQAKNDGTGDENSLLNSLGEFGDINRNLWLSPAKAVPFGDCPDSTLGRIKKSIFEGKAYSSSSSCDDSVSVTAVPSKLHEVEELHSKICHLILDGKAALSDILVVSPDINSYRVSIKQVFDQVGAGGDNGDRPHLPYTILDYSGNDSLVASGISVIFEIIKKNSLCRADFFALLRNPYVQQVLGVSNDDVSSWFGWVSELNVYRDRDEIEGFRETVRDWEKAKNRLLLARLSDCLVGPEENQVLPYSSIESDEDECLCKFIKAVDSLEALIGRFGGKSSVSLSDVKSLKEALGFWFKVSSFDLDENFSSEAMVYSDVEQEIDFLISLLGSEKDSLDMKCLCLCLDSACGGVLLHCGAAFTSGITFMRMGSSRILPAKYVFMIGMDSKSFPGVDRRSVLDLHKPDVLKGDDSVPLRNRNGFLCQLLASGEGLFISYVKLDLQKDKEFFKSNVVNDLMDMAPELFESRSNIDEKRRWEDLFTSRELRNKENYELLSGVNFVLSKEAQDKTSVVHSVNSENPERVSISEMKKYLEDPFQFMAGCLFGGSSAEGSDEENAELEVLDFDFFTQRAFMNSILEKGVSLEELKQNSRNLNKLPDGCFGDMALKGVFEDADFYREKFEEFFGDLRQVDFNRQIDVPVNTEGNVWHLIGECCMNQVIYSEGHVSEIKAAVIKDKAALVMPYLTALALVASLPESECQEVSVYLRAWKKDDEDSVVFDIDRNTALKYLSCIYYGMYIEKYSVCIPMSIWESMSVTDLDPDSFEYSFDEFSNKLVNSFNGNGAWTYFAKASLFDYRDPEVLGYGQEYTEDKFLRAVSHQKSYFKYLVDSQAGENE